MKDLAPNIAPYFPKIFLEAQTLVQKAPNPGNIFLWPCCHCDGCQHGSRFRGCQAALTMRLWHPFTTVRSMSKGGAAAESFHRDFTAAKIPVWLLRLHLFLRPARQGAAHQARHCRPRCRHHETQIIQKPLLRSRGSGSVNYLSTMLLVLLIIPVLGQKSVGWSTPGRLPSSKASLPLGHEFPQQERIPLLASSDDASGFDARALQRLPAPRVSLPVGAGRARDCHGCGD